MTRVENRWFAQLQGVKGHEGASGEYDLYVVMATRYQWTPEEVNALDRHFLDELLAYQQAEARHNEKTRQEAEARANKGR